jgi:hypothetical protein
MQHAIEEARAAHMKTTLKVLILAAVLAAGCRRGAGQVQRQQQNYDVVQEGQTSAATSTITAPGEVPPPLTNTNADTTSNFTLDPTATAGTQAPGTIAGTMTSMPPSGMRGLPGAPVAPPPPRPAPRQPRVVTTTQTDDRVVVTNTAPPQTDTTASIAPIDTTSTQPPPDTRKPKKEKPKEEPPPATTTDEQAPPPQPPPPTTTDTRG